MTELGNAYRFVSCFGDRLRFVSAWAKWLVWDGVRWRQDGTGQADRYMKMIARAVTTSALALDDAKDRDAAERLARRGEQASAIAGALRLAATDSRIAVDLEHLDADPYLLNCANGILDLRTGLLGPHDPDALLTKVTVAGYHPQVDGAEFTTFLERVQPDPQMRGYLARLLGHTLLGKVEEHVLPILFGTGANGKSTLTDVVLLALGDYAAPADPDLLMARKFEAHPTGVADLFGLRLALLHESDRGRHLAEGTVKRLTGGDRLKARRMREDFWSFVPSHSFVMATNHRPIVAGTDEGIWRRIRLVPFDVIIPEAERDTELPNRLALELDAVLSWLVAGYAQWRSGGLAEPDAVRSATDSYRAESDTIRRFLEERCLTGPHYTVRSGELFADWQKWCAGEGTEAGTNKAFTTELEKRGFDTKKRNGYPTFLGLGLQADDVR